MANWPSLSLASSNPFRPCLSSSTLVSIQDTEFDAEKDADTDAPRFLIFGWVPEVKDIDNPERDLNRENDVLSLAKEAAEMFGTDLDGCTT